MPRPLAIFFFFFTIALIFGAIFMSQQDADTNVHRTLHHSHHIVEDYN